MRYANLIDHDGFYVRVPLDEGDAPDQGCAPQLAAGWRHATPAEIEEERELVRRRADRHAQREPVRAEYRPPPVSRGPVVAISDASRFAMELAGVAFVEILDGLRALSRNHPKLAVAAAESIRASTSEFLDAHRERLARERS